MNTDVDVDRDVAIAWHGFRYRLAAGLADLGAGERLVIETPTVVGTSIAVVAERHGRSLVVGAGNAILPQEHVGSDEAAVAALVTRWLRGPLAVVHPAFLMARVETAAGSRALRGDMRSSTPRAASAPGMTAVTVTSAQQLHRLVEPILEDVLGHPAERDEDGDYVLDYGDPQDCPPVPAYVRVRDNVPVLEILTTLHPVESYAAGVAEANALNTSGPLLFHFAVVDNQIVGRMEIWCFAFVPDQVRAMLRTAVGRLEELGGAGDAECAGCGDAGDCDCDCADGADCADRADWVEGAQRADEDIDACGRATAIRDSIDSTDNLLPDATDVARDADDDADDGALRAELAALLQETDPAGDEGIEPELVARICGWDSSLILDFIRVCEFEALECRLSTSSDHDGWDLGNPTLVAAYEHEIRSWEATADVLLRALRVTVERA